MLNNGNFTIDAPLLSPELTPRKACTPAPSPPIDLCSVVEREGHTVSPGRDVRVYTFERVHDIIV